MVNKTFSRKWSEIASCSKGKPSFGFKIARTQLQTFISYFSCYNSFLSFFPQKLFCVCRTQEIPVCPLWHFTLNLWDSKIKGMRQNLIAVKTQIKAAIHGCRLKKKKRKKSDIPASSRPNQMTSSESESKGNCEILNSASIFNKAKTHKTLVISLGSAGLPLWLPLYFLPSARLWSVCAAVQRLKLPLIPNSLISRSIQLFGGFRTETWHFLRPCKSEKCFFFFKFTPRYLW